jgi:hypothetical protein
MAFPTGWPPRGVSGRRNIRFSKDGTTTALFEDNAYLFIDEPGANPYQPLPNVEPGAGVSNPRDPGPHVIPAPPTGTGQRPGDPYPMIWSNYIFVENQGAARLEYSFDGTNVAGSIAANSERIMERAEAGIALRGGSVAATGTITTIAVASLVDGETFTLDDGINPAVVFEFDKAGDGVTPGNILVDVSAIVTADEVRDAIISAVTGVGATLRMSAANGGAAQVDLTQDDAGPQGNTTQTDTVVNVGFVITNMTGGAGLDFHVEAW